MHLICNFTSSALRGALDAGVNSVSARLRLIVAGVTTMLGGEVLVPCILLSRRGLIRRNVNSLLTSWQPSNPGSHAQT